MRHERLAAALAAVLLFAFAAWWRSRDEPMTSRAARTAPAASRAPLLSLPPRASGRDAGALRGSVSTREGEAVPGARVCATCASCDATLTESQRCVDADASGKFELPELETIGYRVVAAASGFVPGAANRGEPVFVTTAGEKRDLQIVLSSRGVELAGVVLDALGGPIAAARVRAVQFEGASSALEVLSDAEGRFSVWTAPGSVTLNAQADGYAPARRFRVAPSRDVELVLTPASSLSGTVLNAADGSPVPGAEVRAYRVGNVPLPADSPVRSGGDGQFVLERLDQGEYVVEAVGQNYRGRREGSVAVGLGERVEGVTVMVSAASMVSGRVLIGSQRAPCPEGNVTLGPPGPSPYADPQASEQIRHAAAAIASGAAARPISLAAPIGAEGSVRFDGVPQGQYLVSVNCANHSLRSGPQLLAVGPTPIADLEWRVARGLGLTIWVRDEEKRPLPQAQIALVYPPFEPGGPAPVMPLTTDANGRYDTPSSMYAGEYRLEPFGGAEGEPVSVTLREGAGPAEVVMTLRGSASLLVSAHTPEGEPVDGLEVTAQLAEEQPAGAGGRRWLAGALGAGEYRFAPLRAGRYRVEASDGINPPFAVRQGAATSVEVGAGRAVRASVVLPRSAEIRGTVRDSGGAPLANVWVSAENESSEGDLRQIVVLKRLEGAGRTLSDGEGQFRLERLARDATFTLRAEQPGGTSQVARGVRPGSEVALVLEAPGRVRGLAVDAAGAPIDSFHVQAVHVETGERRGARASSGRFALDGITPGAIELTATDANHRVGVLRVELAPGQTFDGARLVLAPVQVADLPAPQASPSPP